MSLRTPLARVRGLGSARDGTKHWWFQRLTAIALVPLSLWLVASLIANIDASYAEVVAWVRSPAVTALLLMVVMFVFYHAQLGLQVVIEDYVHLESAKIAILVLVKITVLILALLSATAVIRVAVGS